MKRFYTFSLAVLVLAAMAFPIIVPKAKAVTGSDWRAGGIIDDAVFTDKNSMSINDIQQFLNQKVGTNTYGTPGVCDTNGTKSSELGGGTRAQYGAAHSNPTPFTCLKDYYEVPKMSPGPGIPDNNYGGAPIPAGAKSAANLIYDAAQASNISPKVLLVTIQKESAGPLITDDWPFRSQYTYAMGAHCPDSGPGGSANCDSNYAGFSIQIAESAALLRYYLDNMSQPWWPYKKLGNNTIQYNPSTACGSSTINIESTSTAALYTYTPYQPNQAALNNMYGLGDSCSAYGNRNFWRMFNDWFGSTLGANYFACHNSTNLAGVPSGDSIIANKYFRGQQDYLTMVHLNNTGTNCIEVHTWQPGYQSWLTNIATNMPAADSSAIRVIHGDTDGDGQDELIYVHYTGTSSGKVEIHTWKPGYQHWLTNIITNLPCISPDTGQVISGDVNGDGKDELIFVQYYPTGSGKVEIHTWNPGYQSWQSNIATNLPNQSPNVGQVISGNVFGEGRDRLMYVQYYPTGSGKVEIHTWNPGYQSWQSNIATNLPNGPPSRGQVIAGNTYGDSTDEVMFAQYGPTGSGKVEIHTWKPGYQSWLTNLPTNLSQLQQ